MSNYFSQDTLTCPSCKLSMCVTYDYGDNCPDHQCIRCGTKMLDSWEYAKLHPKVQDLPVIP